MQKRPSLRKLFCFLAVLGLCLSSFVPRLRSAPQGSKEGAGIQHRDDPCAQLPDPPGKALGIDKKCPGGGSSSGIAKGDFNGDGFADLAIGQPDATIAGQAHAGSVTILYGGPGGLTTNKREEWDLSKIGDPHLENANLVPATFDRFAFAIASGDFNGDGYSDLAIGIPGRTAPDPSPFFLPHAAAGAVVILYGSANGLTTNLLDPSQNYCDLACAAPSAFTSNFRFDNAGFGSSLSWGNFNGDKNNGNDVGDLAIGMPTASEEVLGIITVGEVGAVLVVPGSKTAGLGDSWRTSGRLLTEFGSLGISENEIDRFGSALSAGDFNGDGFSDLAISASGAANIHVIYGSTNGLNPFGAAGIPAAQEWTPVALGADAATFSDFFGSAMAAGDFNGDGKTDLAIGAPGKAVVLSGAGIVFVLPGSNSGLTAAGGQIWTQATLGRGAQENANFGAALAAGDFNADGTADLAIGAPQRDINGFTNAGEVDIIYGSKPAGLSMTAARPPQFWTQDTALGAGNMGAGNRFGSTLTAWNFGRNELVGTIVRVLKTPADLAIGAPFQSVNGVSGAGAVDVLYGSFTSNGLTNTQPNIFTAPNTNIGAAQAGAHFGLALY